jgi:hypothetical protein
MILDIEDVVNMEGIDALRDGVMRHARQFVEDWMKIPSCDLHGQPVASCGRELFTVAVAGLIHDVLTQGVMKETPRLGMDD